MKRYDDRNGLAYTATRLESAETFADLTSAYMRFLPETGDILDDLFAEDPEMPMAICAKGYFAKLMGNGEDARRARDFSQKLDDRLDSTSANERERRHASALSAWTAGQLDRATDFWEQILLDDPRDGLALSLAHFAHLYSGDGRRIRDSVARVLPLWPKDHPDYGYLLGMYAFGLEESGEYTQAEAYGRRAVECNPQDAWSVHSVAHVMEMTGRYEEGVEWVAGLEPSWSTVNNFRFHLYWHQCLYHLECSEFAQALQLYDEQVVSDIASDLPLDMCNATSLLWRLEMFGVDIGGRWQDLAEIAKNHIDDTDLIFVSLHHLMALTANGDTIAAERMLDTIRRWSRLDTSQSKICASVGIALAESLSHARRKEHHKVIEKLERVRYDFDQIGGSKAQRDVFHMILLDAAQAGTDVVKARALFAERVGQRGHSHWSWQGYSTVLKSLGQDTAAREAAAKASEIRAAHATH